MPRRRHRRRHSTLRLLRAVWRYRGRIEAHGAAYQVELATSVRTALDARAVGRAALGGYRLAMRALISAAIALVVLALLVAALLWQLEPWFALLALPVLLGAAALLWWRFTWGAPLDWLTEHADPEREVPLRELPTRLRALAAEARDIANVPERLSDELDALASDVAAEATPDGRQP